ncbi:flavin-containing monooxygenase 5-like isoform X2 [Sorex araneus]|uniref:flavin-containing monooxygenase 5-like isoform X2 n=1 Tax=Sorex araneus TaxID=42254 RepID=UPI002433BD4E|nr:flavin-containing monooxygenase 5-like isoform X2 [Sorex araneus]
MSHIETLSVPVTNHFPTEAEMPGKKIAVIGAGVSGLGALKSCLEEGLEPTCFEESSDIGGLWRYEESLESSRPSIYRSATSNTSKEMMAFSDFPFPASCPNYMHNTKLMAYLHSYAAHFHLRPHIRFLAKVRSVRRRPDFSSSGQWDVVVEVEGEQERHVFDGVMVCTGLYTHPAMPLQSFPGISRFQGQYFHSKEYKTPDKFRGKRILVVGVGNSGVDLAIELSHVAEQVFLSTRRGSWIWNRVWDNGMPMDTVLFTRFNNTLGCVSPNRLVNYWMERKLNRRFSHRDYGLLPRHRFLSHQATMSDELPNHIISGRVLMKANVRAFSETSATFADGTEEPVDVVVFATGYTLSFPFLEKDARVLDSDHTMFKFVFPPQLERPTLAFIGILQPVGATIPTSELQSRWAARVFRGVARLPSEQAMMDDIRKTREIFEKEYLDNPRDSRRVQYVEYMDEVASEIGVKPSLLSLCLGDPKLAWEVYFGPCTPYQYRLQGPGKWAGAREAILGQRERIIKPMRTRTLSGGDQPSSSSGSFWLASLCAVLLLFVLAVGILRE